MSNLSLPGNRMRVTFDTSRTGIQWGDDQIMRRFVSVRFHFTRRTELRHVNTLPLATDRNLSRVCSPYTVLRLDVLTSERKAHRSESRRDSLEDWPFPFICLQCGKVIHTVRQFEGLLIESSTLCLPILILA